MKTAGCWWRHSAVKLNTLLLFLLITSASASDYTYAVDRPSGWFQTATEVNNDDTIWATSLSQPIVSPRVSSKDFGTVIAGKTASYKYKLSNKGKVQLNLSIGTGPFTGANASEFGITSNGCTKPVKPNGSCTITVTFAPATPGLKSATLSLTSNDPDSPTVTLSLSGTGGNRLTASPLSKDYGTVKTGQAKSQTFTVSNKGATPLTLSPLHIDGDHEFTIPAVKDKCSGKTLNPKASCSVITVFTPSGSTDPRSGTLIIPSNDFDTPEIHVGLTGTGNPPEPQGAVFSFNEGSGNTTSDSGTTKLNGQISGGAKWVPGKTGTALAFDNPGSQVYIPYTESAKLESQEITVQAWVRPNSVPTDRTSLIVGNSFSWKLQLASGRPEFWVNYGLGSEWGKLVSWGTKLVPGTWYHIAVTYNGSEAKMYVNGTLIDTSSLVYSISYDEYHRQIFIGGSRGCCQFQDDIDSFPGTVDNVKICSTVLSGEDIGNMKDRK